MSTEDIKKKVSETLSDVTAKAKAAYEKGTGMVGEMTEFTQGNVEAMVESGKIFATGLQSISQEYIADSKSAFESATGDLKKMASVKSPTELFQLQGELMRRNFDGAVEYGSKSSEKIVKLANDAFAPISTRVSIAVDKASKVA